MTGTRGLVAALILAVWAGSIHVAVLWSTRPDRAAARRLAQTLDRAWASLPRENGGGP